MKKIAVVLFFIAVCSFCYSQVGFIGIGYNASNGDYKDFNFVIDRYNETRSYLTKEMDNINLTHGLCFDVAYVTPGFIGGFGIQYNRAKVSAKGPVNEVMMQRDLKLHCLNVPLELGFAGGSETFTAAPGIGINFLFWKFLTRTGEPDNIDDKEYDKEPADMGMHAKFFVKFIIGGIEEEGFGIMLEPYYNLGLIGSDMTEMNRTINRDTYFDDPDKSEVFSQYGLRLLFLYKFEG